MKMGSAKDARKNYEQRERERQEKKMRRTGESMLPPKFGGATWTKRQEARSRIEEGKNKAWERSVRELQTKEGSGYEYGICQRCSENYEQRERERQKKMRRTGESMLPPNSGGATWTKRQEARSRIEGKGRIRLGKEKARELQTKRRKRV